MGFDLERRFRVWDYNISHKQMLLRSPESPEEAENIDVIFWDVDYIEIPTAMDGLSLDEATGDEIAKIGGILAIKHAKMSIYCLVSGGLRFLIVAGGYKVLKNKLDVFESSLEYFAATAPDREPGTVLSHS